MKKIKAADLFCGAGGTSTGFARACKAMGVPYELLAVNHWDRAIQTHSSNHPDSRHICARLDQLNPSEVIPGGRLDLLMASPECTHHSIARGGKPMLDQSRASAWEVVRWASQLYIKAIVMENVSEFLDWGPLGANGKPLKSRKGELFNAFVESLIRIGYRVEWKVLCSADYGAAQTRKRLFLQARRDRNPISWPVPTHSTDQWRPARDIIEWDIKGESIFGRKKPLVEKTLHRIQVGINKFHKDPFLIKYYGTATANDLSKPLDTVTTNDRFALVQPFIVKYYGSSTDNSIDKPLGTVTTNNKYALVDFEKSDIKMRMLTPRELARAQGFPDSYKFSGGKKEMVKQIGNAVEVNQAMAICSAVLSSHQNNRRIGA